MHTLVVSACSARKLEDDGQLSLFGGVRQHTARERYQGRAHLRVLKAVDQLRKAGVDVEWSIVSAGKGLLDENDYVENYNVAFKGITERQAKQRGRALNLPAALRERARKAGLVLLVLPKLYLAAVDAPLEEDAALSKVLGPRCVYFASPTAQLGQSALHVLCGKEQAEALGEPQLEIGAARFEDFARRVASGSLDSALRYLESRASDDLSRRNMGLPHS